MSKVRRSSLLVAGIEEEALLDMTEGYLCTHCQQFFPGKPTIRGSFKNLDDEDQYSSQLDLCKECSKFLEPTKA